MKVTIGIPCWNQAQYLPKAIESALNQTHKNIEVIVVNDGSPDNTEEVAKSYGSRITLVNQVNKGLASARNTAIMHMSGDYFLPLDADDILTQNCVEEIVKVAKKTDADVIAPSIQEFGISHARVELIPNPKFEDFAMGNRLAYCSAIKWDALLETGGYSPKMDRLGGFEDLHLWYDLLSRGKKIVTISEPLVFYRTKETSMFTQTKGKERQLWEQITKDFPQTKSHAKA